MEVPTAPLEQHSLKTMYSGSLQNWHSILEFKNAIFRITIFRNTIFRHTIFRNTIFKNTIFRHTIFRNKIFRNTILTVEPKALKEKYAIVKDILTK